MGSVFGNILPSYRHRSSAVGMKFYALSLSRSTHKISKFISHLRFGKINSKRRRERRGGNRVSDLELDGVVPGGMVGVRLDAGGEGPLPAWIVHS